MQTRNAAAPTDLDRRIVFHPEIETMEADFSDFHFDSSRTVNLFYDRLEERITEFGEDRWFFLVNLCGTRIDPEAWVAYSRRGRALNLAHSMGSVRFDASEATRRQIERAADTEAFDPNLHASRAEALARIAHLPGGRVAPAAEPPARVPVDVSGRIRFDPEIGIMEVDFSHFTFRDSADVDDVYDGIERGIGATGRKWFFLVNLNGCEILPAAWVRYAYRGKRLNLEHALGSVRFAAGSETEADIRMRAESQGFRPNIRNTREEALERIAEMKAEAGQGQLPS